MESGKPSFNIEQYLCGEKDQICYVVITIDVHLINFIYNMLMS